MEQGIQGSDLVLIPFGHWVANYEYDEFKAVINNFASNGGGVLFTGYNDNEYGVFENSYAYTDWCCGNVVGDDYNEWFDQEHPIMEGLGSTVDIFFWELSYLADVNDVDTVMTINYWGEDNSRTIFSKAVGQGRVTVFGPILTHGMRMKP